jgi:methylated-DNA-protein-cysteine methyltransferase related protein
VSDGAERPPPARSTPNFEDDVYRALSRVAVGAVMTYGEVAQEAGHPGAARAVGGLLARGGTDLPWWRVVTSTGRLVPGQEDEHARLLRSEGVEITGGHVVMRGGGDTGNRQPCPPP